jgi:hypothetical protein
MPVASKYHFPEKVHLSGPDCFHLVLDLHAKKYGAGGNVMRKVFRFRHQLDEEKVKHILIHSPAIHWLCNIELNKGNLVTIPYWKYRNAGRRINIYVHDVQNQNEIPQHLLRRDIPVESAMYVEADILRYPNGESAFILSWNHILLDAKGSTLLFEHLNRVAEGIEDSLELFFPQKQKRASIIGYIRNMYKVKAFIQHSSRKPISSVSGKTCRTDQDKSENLIINFSAEETHAIHKAGFDAGSRFGPTHYFLSCCAQIIHRLNKQRNRSGPLWIPVPYDGRLKGGIGPLFSNCVSFIFYRLEENHLNSVKDTVKELSMQMMDQIRTGMPKKYDRLLSMMRHIPLWLYYFLISRTGEGSFASFLYTSTGDNFNRMSHLFGEPVTGISMIPALTFPPGFTFVFMKHDDELSLNISYSPDVITEAELNFVVRGIKDLLIFS